LKFRRIEGLHPLYPFPSSTLSSVIISSHRQRRSEFNQSDDNRTLFPIMFFFISFLPSRFPSAFHRWRHLFSVWSTSFARRERSRDENPKCAGEEGKPGFFPCFLGTRCMRTSAGHGSTSTSYLNLGRRQHRLRTGLVQVTTYAPIALFFSTAEIVNGSRFPRKREKTPTFLDRASRPRLFQILYLQRLYRRDRMYFSFPIFALGSLFSCCSNGMITAVRFRARRSEASGEDSKFKAHRAEGDPLI